jgi:hypothetical protein
MVKPSMFIGSSTEGLEFARAVRSQLTDVAEITVWSDGFFRPGSTFIDALLTQAPRFDFAVLLLTPDDLTSSRGEAALSPRDNVVFELGLFMGRLGRSRTFLVSQSNNSVKLPSDLAGLVAATYEWPRMDRNYDAAVGPACDAVRAVVRDLGASPTKSSQAIATIASQQKEQQKQLQFQQAQIRSLQFTLRGILTRFEYDKIVGLARDEPFPCRYSDEMYNELKRLRALGLANNHAGTGLTTMKNAYGHTSQEFDLRRFFYVTEQGREYLRLRAELTQVIDEEEEPKADDDSRPHALSST